MFFIRPTMYLSYLWPPCVADADIIFCSCGFYLLSFFFLIFLAYSQRSEIGCLPHFHTQCGLSVNLECRSENNVLHAARWKCRTQKLCKNRHLHIIAQLWHVSTVGKNLLNVNISSACPDNMVHFSLLAAKTDCWVWGTPGNFNGFRVLAWLCYCTDVAGRRSTKLCTMFGRLLGWYTTLCLKNVAIFKLSVTLSNLNRFSKFCTAGKRMKFARKPYHLRHVATLSFGN